MGACGCGDFDSRYKLAGPDGITYSINIYSSCHYCHTPVAVDIHRHSPEGVSEWEIDQLPELPIPPYSEGSIDGLGSIVVLDSDVLAGCLNEQTGNSVDSLEMRFAVESAVGKAGQQ